MLVSSRQLVVRTVFALALCIGGARAVAAAAFTQIVNFGDSLCDRGNVKDLTFNLAPNSPYSDGRFSNGPIWVERLSSYFTANPVVASRDGGLDFAYGAAMTGAGTTALGFGFNVPNTGNVISAWTASNNANSTQLFTMLAGGNDLIGIIDSGSGSPQTVADNIRNELQSLYNDGARHLLVANLPDFGKVPRFVGTANAASATAASSAFNTRLATNLAALESANAGLTIYRLDLNTLFNTIIANPATYGFTNTTGKAYGGGYFFGGSVVSNPNSYVFWDEIHPTAAAHQIIGDAAFAAIPEPATLTLVAAGIFLVTLRQRSHGRTRAA